MTLFTFRKCSALRDCWCVFEGDRYTGHFHGPHNVIERMVSIWNMDANTSKSEVDELENIAPPAEIERRLAEGEKFMASLGLAPKGWVSPEIVARTRKALNRVLAECEHADGCEYLKEHSPSESDCDCPIRDASAALALLDEVSK